MLIFCGRPDYCKTSCHSEREVEDEELARGELQAGTLSDPGCLPSDPGVERIIFVLLLPTLSRETK